MALTWPKSVDWFAHPTPPPRQRNTSYDSRLTDHWSQWDPSKQPSLPPIQQSKKPHSSKRDPKGGQQLKLPPITNRDDVDFSRLLALDYQREWIEKKDEKEKLQKQRAKVNIGRTSE